MQKLGKFINYYNIKINYTYEYQIGNISQYLN